MDTTIQYNIPLFPKYNCRKIGTESTKSASPVSGELMSFGKPGVENPILGFLSGRLHVIEASIEQILKEIEEREMLRDRILHELDMHSCEVKEMLYAVAPCGSSPFTNGDPGRRAGIEQELFHIDAEKRREESSSWKDVANLKRELRVLLRERMDEERRQDAVMPR